MKIREMMAGAECDLKMCRSSLHKTAYEGTWMGQLNRLLGRLLGRLRSAPSTQSRKCRLVFSATPQP
jgi:hypothetical protein